MARGITGFHWLVPPSNPMGADVQRRRREIPPTLKSKLEGMAADIESYMYAAAPWTDRTGEARAGLTAEFLDEGDVQTIAAYHTAPHGIFLELGTRYMAPRSIIAPTLQSYYGRVNAVMKEITG